MDFVPVAELEGHDDRVWHVAWNPTRPLLASCSADRSVRIYHYRAQDDGSFCFSHLTTIPTGHAKTVRAVAWSPSGRTLATASFDSNIGIWEQEEENPDEGGVRGDWECMSLLEGHETECKSVAYSSSGNLLASCSRDKTVWIWEVHPDSDFECMSVLMEHTQDVKCVAWHPTQEILASASYDDTIKLYIDDPSDDWYCFDTLEGHTSTVWSLSFSPSGSHLASASDDRTIRIWAPELQSHRWKQMHVINNAHERSIYGLSWSCVLSDEANGEDKKSFGQLATGGGDGVICIWDVLNTLPSPSPTPSSVTMTKLITPLLARLPNAHGMHDVNAVSWCPREEGQGLLASVGDDDRVRIWRLIGKSTASISDPFSIS